MNAHHEPDTFDVKTGLVAVFDAVKFHRWLVASCCVITLALVTVYIVLYPPIYKAEATIMSEREHDPTRDTYYASWDVFRKDDARTEMALMTSGAVISEVVKREHLGFNDVYHTFMTHTRYLWDISWPGRKYKAIKEWMFPRKPGDPTATPEEMDRGKTLEAFKEGVTIEPVAESYVAKLTVKGPSPRVAKMANTLLDVYFAHRAQRYYLEARTAYDALSAEVDRAGKEAHQAATERLVFARKHGLAFDFNKQLQELQTLNELEAGVDATRAKIASFEASLSQIDAQLNGAPETMKLSSATQLNALRETAKAKRLDLQLALIQTEAKYRSDSPEVQEIKRDIERVDALINSSPEKIEAGSTEGINSVHQNLVISRNQIQTEMEGARANLAVSAANAARMRQHLAGMPALQQTMRELDTRFSAAHDIYQALLIKLAQTDVTMVTAKAGPQSMHIVDYASTPFFKYWPKVKYLYPAALALGLLLGVFAAVVKSFFEGKIRRGDVEGGRVPMTLYSTIEIPAARPALTVVPRTDAGGTEPPAAVTGS